MINYLRGHWISDMLRDTKIINLHVIFVCFLVFLIHWMHIELIAYIVWFIRYLKYMYDKGLYR